MVLLGIFSVIFIITPEYFIRLFIDDPDIVKTGAQGLRIVSLGFVFYAMGMVMVQAFNGAGDTRTPTKINIVCFWIIEIPLAYLLATSYGFNEYGVYTAIIIAESFMTIIAMWLFKKGKWKKELI